MEGWIAILVIGGLLFLWGYGESLASSEKVVAEIRGMLHKERLSAIEKGLPAPDGNFDEALIAYLADSGRDTLDRREKQRQTRGWVTTLILGGIGWGSATLVIPSGSQIGWLRDAYGFGFIPIALGIGVLIHSLWSRD